MAIAFEDIFRAADELDAEGIKPTLAAVRKRIGKGSYTTIQEAMNEWRARRSKADRVSQEPPPAELAERVTMLAGDIWGMARAAADQALAGERERIAAEQVDMQAQLAEATELADRLTDENDAMTAELAQLRPLPQQIEAAETEVAAVKKKAAEDIHRAMEKANAKDTEAIEARRAEREATKEAARQQGQVEALQQQLRELTASIRPDRGTTKK